MRLTRDVVTCPQGAEKGKFFKFTADGDVLSYVACQDAACADCAAPAAFPTGCQDNNLRGDPAFPASRAFWLAKLGDAPIPGAAVAPTAGPGVCAHLDYDE